MATSIVVRRGSGDIGRTDDFSDSGAMAGRRGFRRVDGGAVYPAAMGAAGAGSARGPGGARAARRSPGVTAFRHVLTSLVLDGAAILAIVVLLLVFQAEL